MISIKATIRSKSFQRSFFFLWFFVFVYVIIVNAYVVDDAYITFRTIDNFVNGHGLRWNIDERVQVYTHPLWMLVMSLFYSLTSEMFFTSIAVSLIICLCTITIASYSFTKRFKTDFWRPTLFLIGLIASKAFVDYTSSGLENALSYFICILFYSKFLLTDKPPNHLGRRDLAWLFCLASLAFINRHDTLLLYAPAIIYVTFSHLSKWKWKYISLALVATLPASIWTLFSLFYYGFLFPNTAYAKVIGADFPASWRILRGLQYLWNSFQWDTAIYIMLIAALGLSLKRRSRKSLVSVAGVFLYITYVVVIGGSATHMSGRFFAVPLFLTIVIFVEEMVYSRFALAVSLLLLFYIIWSPGSAVKFGTPFLRPYRHNRNTIDTKLSVYSEGAALINWRPYRKLPDHEWYHYGEKVREEKTKVHVGGAFHGQAIGYFGFAAGPDVFIVDLVALGDPLLARMPAMMPNEMDQWKSGHFHRHIPDGYIQSVARGENLISDPYVHQYYDIIRNITRGPIFSSSRLKHIWKINFGKYNYLIERQRYQTNH